LYEAANVMLTRYKGQLKLKDWAFAIAKRSTMRKARVALARPASRLSVSSRWRPGMSKWNQASRASIGRSGRCDDAAFARCR
jgi:hypothetical protein